MENIKTDPVCGMLVEKKNAKTTDYNGQTYYFCSDECKTRFEQDPAKFTMKPEFANR